ncbi:MAG: sensor histidine kinase [Vulcanibacillus sp.]
MIVLLLLIGLFQYILMSEFLYKNQASNIQSQVFSVHPEIWEELLINARAGIPSHSPSLSLSNSTISFIDKEGKFLILSNPLNNIELNPPLLSEEEYQDAMKFKRGLNYKVVNQTEGDEQLLVLQPINIGRTNGVIQVSLSTKPLQDMLIQQLLIFLFIAILALFGGILAFKSVLKKTLVPLSNLVNKVENIDVDNLNERLPIEQGQVEIDRLAESCNNMLERLELSFEAEKEAKEQMRRFVADASHELRTPLTSIHGFLEVLLRGAINQPDQLNKSVKSMYVESERMKKLVQDLLLLARLDRSPDIQLVEGRLDDVIKEMEPQLILLSGNRKVSFKLDVNIKCNFDVDKMKQVILNLYQNAVQHTDSENGIIKVYLTKVLDGIELAISDNGLGIPDEHLPHLFDRFYRIDYSRTRQYGGSGLGLSITKSIIVAHEGKIWVESDIGKGSTFYIWLPLIRF